MVSMPARGLPVVFGSTVYIITPLPEPLAGGVMVIHATLLCTSHGQVVALLPCTDARPPSLEKVSLAGVSVAGGSDAVTLADAVLLLLRGSRVAAVTEATLLTAVPLLTPQLSVAV